MGITASQIISFLRANAHPETVAAANASPGVIHCVPVTVADQIRLWEDERHRLVFFDSALYSTFESEREYVGVKEYTRSQGYFLRFSQIATQYSAKRISSKRWWVEFWRAKLKAFSSRSVLPTVSSFFLPSSPFAENFLLGWFRRIASTVLDPQLQPLLSIKRLLWSGFAQEMFSILYSSEVIRVFFYTLSWLSSVITDDCKWLWKISSDILLWFDDVQRLVVVTEEGHDMVKAWWKANKANVWRFVNLLCLKRLGRNSSVSCKWKGQKMAKDSKRTKRSFSFASVSAPLDMFWDTNWECFIHQWVKSFGAFLSLHEIPLEERFLCDELA